MLPPDGYLPSGWDYYIIIIISFSFSIRAARPETSQDLRRAHGGNADASVADCNESCIKGRKHV